jgi:hypothetical protein
MQFRRGDRALPVRCCQAGACSPASRLERRHSLAPLNVVYEARLPHLHGLIPDHGKMTVRPPSGIPLPDLVLTANRVLTEEADALRAALADFSNAPQPGCPWSQDDKAVSDHAVPGTQGRATLLLYTRHQATLTYANAHDHLLTMARALGGDGAMPLFSHASVSRVVCEAAVRFAWLMDPSISSEERIVRGAVALHISAYERAKGVRALPPGSFDPRDFRQMTQSSTAEQNTIQELITSAGLTFGYSQNGKTKTSVKLESHNISEPLKPNITELMARLLPESPSWYNIGSSVTHSIYWGLRDVDGSRPGEPLELTPNVLDVGAAVQSAISASALILDRCARCFGHDPSTQMQQTKRRREAVGALMHRATTSTWAKVPAE